MNGTSRLFRLAVDQFERGQVDRAVETLARLLGEEPDDADAHALLALCLVRRRRLHAARLEAETALRLAPESVFAHRAVAAVLSAARRFDEALAHLQAARALDPGDPGIETALASLHLAWGRAEAALPHAERARALAPDDVDAIVALAAVAKARGRLDEAAALAREALARDPESVDALVIAGEVALASGHDEEAREHAAWALQQDPEDAAALALLCATKAKRSLWLGLWWRFQSYVTRGGGARSIAILLGLFVLYRTASIVLEGHGRTDIADALRIGWLGFCVYTWVAPSIFLKSVRRELEQVRLRPGF